MFDAVAKRYDITNTVLSAGQDRYWRRATRSALAIGPGDKVLDLAAGTAVSTVELARSGAWCVACDFSVGMLKAGARRPVPKVAGDATKLPFADGMFDAVTISFGLRNVVDTVGGLREMARVTRPGGVMLAEFYNPLSFRGLAKRLGPGKTIVTILADSGNRYQSKLFNPEFMRSKKLPVPEWLERKSNIKPPFV